VAPEAVQVNPASVLTVQLLIVLCIGIKAFPGAQLQTPFIGCWPDCEKVPLTQLTIVLVAGEELYAEPLIME
jgi:hypothetical protein